MLHNPAAWETWYDVRVNLPGLPTYDVNDVLIMLRSSLHQRGFACWVDRVRPPRLHIQWAGKPTGRQVTPPRAKTPSPPRKRQGNKQQRSNLKKYRR